MAPQKKQNGSRTPLKQAGQSQPGGTRTTRGYNAGANKNAAGAYGNHYAYSGYAVKNSGRMANAGAIHVPGSARDAGQYRDRLGDGKKAYPNRRRKIISGQDLTNPLKKKLIADAPRKSYGKTAAIPRERVKVRYRTVLVGNKKFPVSGFAVVVMIALAMMSLIYSYSVLNERSVTINKLRDEIAFEAGREQKLARQLEIKNDLNFIIGYAVEDLDMIKEDLLAKHYITAKSYDKAVIVGDKSNIIMDFPNIMSAIFKIKNK